MTELIFTQFPQALLTNGMGQPNGPTYKGTRDPEIINEVLQIFKEARPIVFNDSYSNEVLNNAQQFMINLPTDPLALPFESCIFEMNGASFLEDDESEKKDKTLTVCSILVKEISFMKYRVIVLKKRETKSDKANPFKYLVYDNVANIYWVHAFVKILNDRANRVLGVERTSINKKVRVNGENHHFKIKKIVHVRPKTKYKEYGTRDVNWSHRWQVMGHWRSISGLGKNRRGDYVVPNFTWVLDHEKGPETKLLVKKNRILLSIPKISPNLSQTGA